MKNKIYTVDFNSLPGRIFTMKAVMKSAIVAWFLFISISTYSQQYSWSRYSTFPEGGTILDIASDNNGTIYVLTQFSRIFYSTDNGDNWAIMQGTYGWQNIIEIEVDKVSGVLYVGTTTQGIWFTSNFGQTWNWEYFYTTGQGLHATIFQVGVKHGTGIVVACEPGYFTSNTYVSTNGGLTWTHYLGNAPFEGALDYLFLQNGTLLAGTERGVYQSTDNGATWSNASVDLNGMVITSLSQRNSGILFAGSNFNLALNNITGTGVYLSNDNGQSWVQSSTGIFDTRISGLYFDEVTATLLATCPSGVFASSNNASSWSSVTFNLADIDINCITGKNSGEVFIGANQDGVSQFGTSNWTLKNHGLFNTSVSDMVLDGSNTFYIAYEGSSGLYKTNIPNQWQHIGMGLVPSSSCNRIIKNTSGHLYATFASSDISQAIVTSTDNGMTWLGIGAGIPVPPNINYASFTDIELGPAAGEIYIIASYSGFTITTFFEVFRSLDNGLTWTSILSADTSNFILSIGDLNISSTGDIYVIYSDFGGTNAAFSTDQGATFNPLNISVPGFFQDFLIDKADSLYLIADNVVYEKNGANWVAKPNGGWPLNYSAHAVSIYFDNANAIYLSCMDDGVYYSNTDGQSWQNITTGIPTYIGINGTYRVHLKDFCFDSANRPYAFSENIEVNDLSIQGIFTFDSVTTTGIIEAKDEKQVNVFPNPSHDIIYLSENITAEYFITDLLGKEIIRQKLYNSNRINIQNLETGFYLLHIDKNTVLKFIKN